MICCLLGLCLALLFIVVCWWGFGGLCRFCCFVGCLVGVGCDACGLCGIAGRLAFGCVGFHWCVYLRLFGFGFVLGWLLVFCLVFVGLGLVSLLLLGFGFCLIVHSGYCALIVLVLVLVLFAWTGCWLLTVLFVALCLCGRCGCLVVAVALVVLLNLLV